MRPLEASDADGLRELVNDEIVYRYLPTYLFEKKYADIDYVISHLYDECLEESLILGIFRDGEFCGLGEMYGYRQPIHKISIGYRSLERFWGKGVASEAVRLMVHYLYNETDIELITASTMPANHGPEHVLIKNGFKLVAECVDEDWGFPEPTPANKWIR